MGLMHSARQVKHAAFVTKKRIRRVVGAGKWRALTMVTPALSRVWPFRYDAQRYTGPNRGKEGHDLSFLQLPPPIDAASSELPRRVFVLWTGNNPLPPNRSRNLAHLRKVIAVPVVLVTPQTLGGWLIPGHPLHPAYEHLSLVHRSDYLRAYLMHHHGGGYIDLKAPVGSWAPAFDRMERDPSAWLSGYGEINANASARFPGPMGRDIATHWKSLVGTAAMIVRSHTPFTGEWIREVDRRMDALAPRLAASPGLVRLGGPGYPVSWTDLLGKVYQPLQFKYFEHIRVDDDLLVNFTDYQ
ncbi:glycosyltransferase family 32 protein [Micrococcus luteus]|uniref:hypothetical protein n=1 Tax=Micrococcus luteus TaxID=1270 RepID=UPI0013310616|nr:hypothetical protein [Micrococcus luteus]